MTEDVPKNILFIHKFTFVDALDENIEETDEEEHVESKSQKELALIVSNVEDRAREKAREQAVLPALAHILKSEAEIICSALFHRGSVVASTLEEPGPAGVPIRSVFELNEYQPISYSVQRMPFNYNYSFNKAVKNMVKVRMSRPVRNHAHFQWRLPKREMAALFHIDYRALNKRMRRIIFR